MAYKQPLNRVSKIGKGLILSEQDESTKKSEALSLASSKSGNVGAPGDPGTEINYDDPKRFAGDDEGMLKNDFKPQVPGDDGYEDQDLNKKQK